MSIFVFKIFRNESEVWVATLDSACLRGPGLNAAGWCRGMVIRVFPGGAPAVVRATVMTVRRGFGGPEARAWEGVHARACPCWYTVHGRTAKHFMSRRFPNSWQCQGVEYVT